MKVVLKTSMLVWSVSFINQFLQELKGLFIITMLNCYMILFGYRYGIAFT